MKNMQTKKPSSIGNHLASTHTVAQLRKLFLISLRKKYVYCPISKVANSSIKAFLFEAELRDNNMFSHNHKLKTSTVHDVFYGPLIRPMQLPSVQLDNILSGDKFFKFVFVRNPIDRLISCYLDRVLTPKSAVHKAVCTGLNLSLGSSISFPDFVELVSTQKPKQMNQHWRPQFDQCGFEKIQYEKVYKFEKLTEGVSDVLKRFYPKVASQIDTSANLSPATTKASQRKEELVTRELEIKIRQIYSADFEAFSY